MSARPSASKLSGVIALAILGISVSGPLARLAESAPLTIAVWRLALSLLILAVPLLSTGSWREWRTLSRGDLAVAVGAGAFLALHFWSWIASLGMTSVAASVLLVNLHPLVIVAGSALWLHERPTRGQLVGLLVALVGAAIVGLAPVASVPSGAQASVRVVGSDHALRDLTAARTVPAGTVAPDSSHGSRQLDTAAPRAVVQPSPLEPAQPEGVPPSEGAVREAARPRRAGERPMHTPVLGNALAVLGAITVGLYYLAGRRLRQRLSLWPYVTLVYGACLAVLLVLALGTGTPLAPTAPRDVGIFALIALGPMLAGHTGFNWALRYVPAFVVSVALLAEPVGAGLIAFLWLGERLDAATLLGGAVVLTGLVWAALPARYPRGGGDRPSDGSADSSPSTSPEAPRQGES